MTARAMSLHKLSLRESKIDVLCSSEELGGCDLLMFLRMQASWGFKGGAAEIARKVAKKTTTRMPMEVFIALGFSCCFCEDYKCIEIFI